MNALNYRMWRCLRCEFCRSTTGVLQIPLPTGLSRWSQWRQTITFQPLPSITSLESLPRTGWEVRRAKSFVSAVRNKVLFRWTFAWKKKHNINLRIVSLGRLWCKTNNNILLFYAFVQDANDSFVPCFAFVLCIRRQLCPFYMDHKPTTDKSIIIFRIAWLFQTKIASSH